jgi:UDPglucose 6-dehydrogenase
LVFVSLDVVTDDENTSDLAPLRSLIDELAPRAAAGTTFVIMSQVPPGFCRDLAAQLPASVALFYQVETLVFGNAIERALRPERYMIGARNPAEALPDLYRRFLEAFECPALVMRYESAELCKIAINCLLVSSVSTTNTLAELCEKIGADWFEIAPALRLDKRIGPHAYLTPGLGIAGGNLERDLATVVGLASKHGCDARVVTAWRQNSAYARDWVLRRLFQLGLLNSAVHTPLAMWGLAYKPDTHSTKNSPALALLRSLRQYDWQAYDPIARIDSAEFPHVRVCNSPLEALRDAEALVVMTPWEEFAGVSLESMRGALRGCQILDPYAALDGDCCRQLGFGYHRLGAQLC